MIGEAVAQSFDVVVLGSGSAGMAAAVSAASRGLSVVVVEKASQLGGTSAWSGGHVWIPANPVAREHGIDDSVQEGVEYLLSLSRGRLREDIVQSWVEAGPEMVAYFDEHAGTDFALSAGIPDYHAEFPGGKVEGGRTLECPLFPFDELGEWSSRVRVSPYYATPQLVMNETPTGSAVPKVVTAEEIEARRVNGDQRGLGQSLIGRLMKAALGYGVEFRTGHRAVHLVKDGHRIVGVVVEVEGGEQTTIGAARGVVIATGGFEHNEEYRREFLRGPLTHPISVPENTGDGLTMVMEAGVKLGMMSEAFWTTVAEVPVEVNPEGKMMLSADRARPRAIMVNRHGARFANESTNYNAFGGAFHQEDTERFEYRNLPCWLVFDQVYLETYGTVRHAPSNEAPAWIPRYESVEALAEGLGVPLDALQATLDRWNADVDAGRDSQFHRGEFAHDLWWGDPERKGSVYGSIGRVDTPPYYAIRVHPGAMGTKGGPLTDVNAQVIGLDGRPVEGLYAAGNAAAAPYGMTYGGAGGTLGPALVGGYLAGRHMASTAAVSS